MKPIKLTFILATTFTSAALASECAQTVLDAQLNQSWRYAVSYQGMSTEAERLLSYESGQWRLQQAMSLLIVSLNEESRSVLEGSLLSTRSYLKEQKGLGARTTRINVDSATGMVNTEYKGKAGSYSAELPLSDQLTHSLQIQIDRNCAVDDQLLEYPLVGRSGVKNHTYRFQGLENLTSPWGELLAERWQRESGDVRDTLWLAPDRNFALIRVEHVEKGELSSLQLTQVQ